MQNAETIVIVIRSCFYCRYAKLDTVHIRCAHLGDKTRTILPRTFDAAGKTEEELTEERLTVVLRSIIRAENCAYWSPKET